MLLDLHLGVKGDHIGSVCTLNFKEFLRDKKLEEIAVRPSKYEEDHRFTLKDIGGVCMLNFKEFFHNKK